jgi:hypothetical protein
MEEKNKQQEFDPNFGDSDAIWDLDDCATQEEKDLMYSVADNLLDFMKICDTSPKFTPSIDELTAIIKALYKNITEDRIQSYVLDMRTPYWDYRKINDKQFTVTKYSPLASRRWAVDIEKGTTFLIWMS